MPIKRLFVFILMLTLCAGISGCDGGFMGGGDETAQTERSADLYFPMERVRTLNPVSGMDEDCYNISKLIYQGLFALGTDAVPYPQLAESAEYSEDGEKITVVLRKGIKWSDGNDFTASDVKFSYDAHMGLSRSGASLYTPYLQGIQSVKVSDSYKVVFTFRSKEECVLENLTVPIVPAHQFTSVSAARAVKDDFVPIGTGPYRVTKADIYDGVVLEANSYYSGDPVQNTITFIIMPDKSNALNLFEIGAIDFTVLRGVDRDTLLNNVEVEEIPFLSNEVEFIGFNFNRTATAKRAVRRAAAYAVDRESILSYAYYGNGQLNDTIYYPGYLGAESNSDAYAYNTKMARSTLLKSGYKDNDGDGILESADGTPLSLELVVNSDNPCRVQAAKTIASGLKSSGIGVTVTELEWEAYSAALARGDYDLYIGGARFRDCSEIRGYLYTGNRIGYENTKVNQKLDQMLGLSEEEKKALFAELQDTLIKDLPYYCLLYKTYGAIIPEGLEGTVSSSCFNIYNGVETFSVQRFKAAPGDEKEGDAAEEEEETE